MNILINLLVIRAGGGLQVAHSLIHELKKIPNHKYNLLISQNILPLVDLESFPDNFSFYLIDSSPSSLKKGMGSKRLIKRIERVSKPDVVFTLFGPSYWKPNSPHLCGYALPHFIYEESPFFKLISWKERIKWKVRGFLKFLLFKRDSNFFVTETEDAAKRLSKKLKISRDQVFTVHNAYNSIFDQPTEWNNVSERINGRAEGFKLITISSSNLHKNLNIIPVVIDYLTTEYPDFRFTFILSVEKNVFKNLSENHSEHMLFLGKVSIKDCPDLYKQSDALFMPTLLECFTVSYLEAMKMNKPILTSNLPFARDICQNAASYFDPMRPEDIGEKIIDLAKNKELQNKLIQQGTERLRDFGTAADRAQSYLNILEKITKDKV